MTALCQFDCSLAEPHAACAVQVYDEVKEELKLRGGYIMSPEECKKAGATIIKDGRLNAGRLTRQSPDWYAVHCAASAVALVTSQTQAPSEHRKGTLAEY